MFKIIKKFNLYYIIIVYRMVNAWMQTVKRVRDEMPKGTSLKEILIAAKKVYKKPTGLVKKAVKTFKKAVSRKKRRKKRKGKKTKKTKKKRTKKSRKKRK